MVYTPVEEFLDMTGSVYKLVILAARRAIELNAGAPRLIETERQKPGPVALEEIQQGKVKIKPKGAAQPTESALKS